MSDLEAYRTHLVRGAVDEAGRAYLVWEPLDPGHPYLVRRAVPLFVGGLAAAQDLAEAINEGGTWRLGGLCGEPLFGDDIPSFQGGTDA